MPSDPGKEPNPNRSRAERGEKKESNSRWLLGLAGLLLLLVSFNRRFWDWLFHPAMLRVEPAGHSNPGNQAPPPTQGHEHRDANAKWIFGILIFLLVFGLSIHGILAGFLGALKHTAPPTDRWRPVQPAALPSSVRQPFPRLQVSPPLDLQTFRMREENELHTYGWVNRTAGVVRIPIEQAMGLVLQQGLPARSNTNANQAGPSTYQLLQQRPEHRQPEIKGEK